MNIEEETTNNTPQQQLSKYIDIYYNYIINNGDINPHHELEVKFGTIKENKRKIIKNDYDNVVKKIKSLGFKSDNEIGIHRLSIQSSYFNKNAGKDFWSFLGTKAWSSLETKASTAGDRRGRTGSSLGTRFLAAGENGIDFSFRPIPTLLFLLSLLRLR